MLPIPEILTHLQLYSVPTYLATNKSAAEGETAERSRSDFR